MLIPEIPVKAPRVEMTQSEELMAVVAPTLPRVRAVWVVVPRFKATAEAVSKVGAKKLVTAVTVPVKLAAEEIVWPLMRPEVRVPVRV